MSLMVVDNAQDSGEAPSHPLLDAAEAVRASGVLGRSHQLLALFDYLVARSVQNAPPKESEIAHDVFGKPGGFETGQDAVVRVYVHRLRGKLDDYARAAQDGQRVTLPKGGYRIVLAGAEPAPAEVTATVPAPRRRWPFLAAAAVAVLALNLGGWALFGGLRSHADPAARALRTPVWSAFAASPDPLLLVVGDYYIFGETEDGMLIDRLIREFEINSPADLERRLAEHPEKTTQYRDVGLSYLPTSSGGAISRLSVLFAGRKPVRVITASQLTPQLLKTHDIVYLGYLSGLGALRDPTFARSRFEIGDSYDEIIDEAVHRRYTSQGGFGPAQPAVYRDYSYVTTFRGPAGNHIAIIAGLRDIGLSAAAEQMTDPAALAGLNTVAAGGKGFEALYEVHGQGEVNYQTRLLAASRRGAGAWAGPVAAAP